MTSKAFVSRNPTNTPHVLVALNTNTLEKKYQTSQPVVAHSESPTDKVYLFLAKKRATLTLMEATINKVKKHATVERGTPITFRGS